MEKITLTTFKNPTLKERIKSMLSVDFYRIFHTPLLYIMIVISALIPALVLTMGNSGGEKTLNFYNVWQVVESVSGKNDGAGLFDLATMCNINMIFIFAAIFISIFVSHDYGSGYIKSVFTVHSKKIDYAFSKSLVGFVGGAFMVLSYLIGAIIAGVLSGKSFSLDGATAINVILCVLSKAALMALFIPLYVTVSVFFKQKLWLSIIGSFALGILFYPVAMMSAPLNSGIMNIILCLAGGAMLGAGGIALSALILNKRDLV